MKENSLATDEDGFIDYEYIVWISYVDFHSEGCLEHQFKCNCSFVHLYVLAIYVNL